MQWHVCCLFGLNMYCLLKFGLVCWRSAWLKFLPNMGNTRISFLHCSSHHLYHCMFTHADFYISLRTNAWERCRQTPLILNGLFGSWLALGEWAWGEKCASFNTAMHIASLICIHAPTLFLFDVNQQTNSVTLCVLRNICRRLVSILHPRMHRLAFPSMWIRKPIEYVHMCWICKQAPDINDVICQKMCVQCRF